MLVAVKHRQIGEFIGVLARNLEIRFLTGDGDIVVCVAFNNYLAVRQTADDL